MRLKHLENLIKKKDLVKVYTGNNEKSNLKTKIKGHFLVI